MSDTPKPPGSLLGAMAGGLAGVAIAWIVAVLGATLAGSSADETSGLIGAAEDVMASGYLLPVLALGGLIGFLVTGYRTDNRVVLSLVSFVRWITPIGVSLTFGFGVGILGYLLLWLREHPGMGWPQALDHLLQVLAAPTPAFSVFFLAGMFAGLAGGLYLVGRGGVRVASRAVTAGLLGALAGLTIFTVASVLTSDVPLDDRDAVLQAIAAAVYSGSVAEWLMVSAAGLAGLALARYSWQTYGIMTFVALIFVVSGYIMYTVTVTLPSVPPQDLWLSVLLFTAEILSLLMVLLYSFYTLDVAARKEWRRTTDDATFSPFYQPKVAIHLATFNEPFEMVKETLKRLLSLDYPPEDYKIMVGDDSTDPACRAPLAAFCKKHGIVYVHREDRTGFKAGALNRLLERTPADYRLIAVVDADYWVQPEYLRETVGYFVDPGLGWLQTPQDYRNRYQSFLTEQYYLADSYFYRAILPSRNEENSIIFCGTMGILRAYAVRQVGGWAEDHITEDAELSARLLNTGWRSQYVNKTFGRGLIPATFDGYKKQHYRWAAGGGRILRSHGLRLLFGRYTFRQRLDNLMGTFTWLEGIFIFGIAMLVLGLGLAEVTGSRFVTHHDKEIFLIGLVPMFLLMDGLTRVHMVLKRNEHITVAGTLRIIGMWFSVKFSNMRAAFKGLMGIRTPFIRTPKTPETVPTRREAIKLAIQTSRFESVLALTMLVLMVALLTKALLVPSGYWPAPEGPRATLRRLFLALWTGYYFLAFFAAPLYAYKSLVTLQPMRPAEAGAAPQESAA